MSFKLDISPKDRATGRFKSKVNKALVKAVLSAKKKCGLTQSQIADLTDMDKSTISRILNGQGNLTLKTIGDISWALRLRPTIIFEEIEPQADFLLNSPSADIPTQDRNLTTSHAKVVFLEDFGQNAVPEKTRNVHIESHNPEIGERRVN